MDPSASTPPRRPLRRALVAVAAALALFAVVAEAAVRVLDPTPRGQVIRGGARARPGVGDLRLLHGEPVWTVAGSVPRQAPTCAAGATEVLLLGSSILWGTGVRPDEAVSRHLQDLLGPAWCVRNHAQPAFVGTSKLAVAREEIPRRRPAVVVWEVWTNDAGDFELLGEDAFNVGLMRVDEAGYPVALPLPAALHHALFRRSRAWEYLTLALAPADPDAYDRTWTRLVDELLPEVLSLADAHGGRLLLAPMPFLDRPFAVSAEEHRTRQAGYRRVTAWAEAHGVPVVDVASALVDDDVAALRLDTCCHYAPAGHRRLAEVLAEPVRALADAE